jgi:beta-1,4-mannosyltransferase
LLLKDKNATLVTVSDNLFLAIATFFWLSYFPVAALSTWKIFKNRSMFIEKDFEEISHGAEIIFQITTRSATGTSVVKRGIQSIICSAHNVKFHNYHIQVVTDDPRDLWTLRDENCEIVVVDKNYHTNAIKKGRALQYAVERRRRVGKDGSKYWIFHMDEESYVMPQTILALLKFIGKGEAIASEGPIFYPLKFDSANRLTAIAESARPFACYDCVSQMTNPPPLHMHGSNLLVRSDIEDAVEWNFGSTLAEDQMFGYKIYEKYGNGSMGWHGGILLEQPPLNLKDHFFQRRRWFLGTMQNLEKFPRWHKYKVMLKSASLFLGFASAVASTALMVYSYLLPMFSLSSFDLGMISSNIMLLPGNFPIISAFTSIAKSASGSTGIEFVTTTILLFTSVVWLGSYQLGLALNLRYSKMKWAKRILLQIQTLLLCPLTGLIETFPAFWAILEYCIKKKEIMEKMTISDFYIIRK